ncbi:MAG: histidine phosphatase family protein [Candidatus Dormibacteria bacterium]
MSKARVVLVRHGETAWSRELRHTGRTNIPLTELGCEQALACRDVLARDSYGLVLCSPLQRARTTCALAGFGERAELRDDLMEWNYGRYEGRTGTEIAREQPGWNIFDGAVLGGESIDDVGARADRIIAEVAERDDDALIFAHGHLIRVLAVRWIELAPIRARHLMLSTGAISALGHEKDDRAIERWNDTHHLSGLGPS